MVDFKKYISNAIEFCLYASRDFTKHEDIIACLKTQNSMVHSRFRYSIARDIASFLYGAYGESVENLNLYGSTMEYTAGIYSDIDIVLKVKAVSSELLETLKHINSLLSEEYYKLLGKDKSEWSYLIDIHIINTDPGELRETSRAYLEHILCHDSVALC